MVDATQVLTVPAFQLAVWRPELVLAATVLVGLVGWRSRLVVLAGLAVAVGLAATTMPAEAVAPLGPHFVVDGEAALVRLVIIAMALVVQLVLRPRDETAGATLALATLGCVWLAEATTLAGLLVAVVTVIIGAGVTALFAVSPAGRPAVAQWLGTAGLGFGVLAFAGTLWCGVTGTLDLAVGPAALALRPSLPPNTLPVLLALLGVGLALALLGEPGRFHRGEGRLLAPVLTGWITVAPALALVVMLGRVLREVIAAPPVAVVPGLVVGLAGVLVIGGFVVALAQPRLERRLAWGAVGQVGLALLGFMVSPDRSLPVLMLLVFAPAQLGAMLLAGSLAPVSSGGRWRDLQLVILTGLLISLAALPPLAGWRPRLELFGSLLAGERYPALAVVAVGTLMGCLVYLRPLVELWREDTGDAEAGEGSPLVPALVAVGLLVGLLGWGVGLV